MSDDILDRARALSPKSLNSACGYPHTPADWIAVRDEMVAAIVRVRELAEQWSTEPCVSGYKVPHADLIEVDSQCLHCGADIVLCVLDGEVQP